MNFFSNRNGCLHITPADIENYIVNEQVSAFIIVNQQGYDETASGTIQTYN